MPDRLQAIIKLLGTHHIDGLLLTYLPHIRWAVGFSGSQALLYINKDGATLITDRRYSDQAKYEVSGSAIVIGQRDLVLWLPALSDTAQRIGIQADHMTVEGRANLEGLLPAQLVDLSGLLREDILVKSADELELMKTAQRISDKVFAELLDVIKPGMTERELAAEIVYRHLRHGADGLSFWPIVTAGVRSALPHAEATNAKLAKGDLVVMDFGCTVEGYCSDMTRTIAIGDPGNEARRVYQLVLNAQLAALKLAQPGVIAMALDKTARDLIQAVGYDIPHSVGHSLGLEVHEWPSLRWVDAPLPAGTVLAIEPGAYVSGRLGVRIEDMITLTEEGNTNLTTSPKELLIL